MLLLLLLLLLLLHDCSGFILLLLLRRRSHLSLERGLSWVEKRRRRRRRGRYWLRCSRCRLVCRAVVKRKNASGSQGWIDSHREFSFRGRAASPYLSSVAWAGRLVKSVGTVQSLGHGVKRLSDWRRTRPPQLGMKKKVGSALGSE
ncbi:hypothetical protein F5X68DRAFT_207448 [Plectosphaerella plurivora]|uniref:Secreted protein n=1 Tax=Plectosphaerella plurivora TaxID=936078 RepID=A0A9P8VBR4_9PEZI|nr:hypothetical protein F5X68DRAFT_207448 [Plectosphaerella plurivora]